MNWYKKFQKQAFMSNQMAAQAVYNRLMQAELSKADGASAVDDLYSQGYDPASIEGAIQQAIKMVVGPSGDETMLTPAQQSVLMALRAQMYPPMEQGLQSEPIDAPANQPIGENWEA